MQAFSLEDNRAKEWEQESPRHVGGGEASGVCSAGNQGWVRPPREAQTPGWKTPGLDISLCAEGPVLTLSLRTLV